LAAPTEREFERWLTQDAGFTRSEARAVMRDGLIKAGNVAADGLRIAAPSALA